MDQIIKERNGNRMFMRISRWNTIDYTIISEKNRFAKYADNYGNPGEKLTLTFFKLRNHTYPIPQFAKLMTPIVLEDLTQITRQDTENGCYYIEINPEKDKVRLYREVT